MRKKAPFISFSAQFWRKAFMIDRRNSAATKVKTAIRNGVIAPLDGLKCVDCGENAFCYDDRDYRKPLKVDPVCKSCDGRRGPGKPYLQYDSKEYKIALRNFKARYRRNCIGEPWK